MLIFVVCNCIERYTLGKIHLVGILKNCMQFQYALFMCSIYFNSERHAYRLEEGQMTGQVTSSRNLNTRVNRYKVGSM